MRSIYIPMGGGVDGTSPLTQMNPGRLRVGQNVECKPGGGYRRLLGYTEYDDDPVPGEGPILGVHLYMDKVYAFRNAVGSATASMYESSGSGWTLKKSGLAAGGRYRCTNYAFSGTQKMYGASGTHKAFQWDGTTWTDLTTGMSPDTPKHIHGHRKHLFLSFDNSVQHSSLGDPTSWSAVTGAGEILQDRDVTGFSTMPNGALGIFTRAGIFLLAGTSAADWTGADLVEYGNNAGALDDTIVSMGSNVRFVDSRGVIDFAASDTSSDFRDSLISLDMDELVGGQWTRATCAATVRAKSQLRVFFDDGTGVLFTIAGNRVMPSRLKFKHVVRCVCSDEDSGGNEYILFGSDDGYIYRQELGRSMGGQAIDAYLETAFTNAGVPHNVKRFRRARFDVGKVGKAALEVSARFIIDDGGLRRGIDATPTYSGDGTPMGTSATLGQTILGGLPLVEGDMDLVGAAQWISFIFRSITDNEDPWEVDGVSLDFFPGRKRR